jgi:hypothetical protein
MAAGGGGGYDPLVPAGVPCAFSPDKQTYFALASTDGHLRVWETANNRLHQEYVPSAHLSGTCTCLAWAPARLQAKVERAEWAGGGCSPGPGSAARGPAWLVAPGSPGEATLRAAADRTGPTPLPRVRPVRRAVRGRGSVPRVPCGLRPCSWAAMFAKAPDPPGALSSCQALLICVLIRSPGFDRSPSWECIASLHPRPSQRKGFALGIWNELC